MGDNYGIANSGSGSINADAMAARHGGRPRAVSGGGSERLEDPRAQAVRTLAGPHRPPTWTTEFAVFSGGNIIVTIRLKNDR